MHNQVIHYPVRRNNDLPVELNQSSAITTAPPTLECLDAYSRWIDTYDLGVPFCLFPELLLSMGSVPLSQRILNLLWVTTSPWDSYP